MGNLTKRTLGRTGLDVTQLGFGAAERGLPDEAEYDAQAGRVLNAALDAGINLVDTAPDYGASEERVGKYLSHRRDEFFLATKCGCNIDEFWYCGVFLVRVAVGMDATSFKAISERLAAGLRCPLAIGSSTVSWMKRK